MKKFATLLLTLLTCILVSGCGSAAQVRRLERQVDREIARTDEYKAMVEELEAENAELWAENNSLTIDIQNYINKNEDLEALKNTSESTSSNTNNTIKELNNQINSLKAQLEAAKNNSYSSSNNTTIANLKNQINVLTLDLQNYKAVADILQKQLDAQIAINKNQSIQSAYSSYVSIKFWSDGKTYYSKYTTWYSDSYCSKKLASQDIIITSPTIDRFEASNGYTVYCCMSNVGLVYTSAKPYLYEVENN